MLKPDGRECLSFMVCQGRHLARKAGTGMAKRRGSIIARMVFDFGREGDLGDLGLMAL
jgi:hypothetical protein